MPGDAQKAFDYLIESIPNWLQSLETIRTRLTRSQDGQKPLERILKKERSGSMESLRPDDGRKAVLNAVGNPSTQPTTEQSSPAAQGTRRIRNATSILSGRLSGAMKYRERHMVVVYYDGEIQKAFEGLVRCIGTGRNMLRKGKMAAKMEALAAAMPSDDDDSSSGDNDVHQYAMKMPRSKNGPSGYGMNRSPRSAFAPLQDDGDTFDVTDKELEKAQGACEKGAHQFLRDGDCSQELDACKDYLLKIANISDTQSAVYKSRMEAKLAREEKEMQDFQQRRNSIEAKRQSFRRLMPEVDLEVDEDEDEDFDAAAAMQAMKAFQRPRRIPIRA